MLDHLKANNRAWAARKVAADTDFFARLARQQAPEYLWIGCSDSRVPANEIVGLDPGELFVHRNVANLAPPQDANYLSVLQFAVDVLKVKHIMVVGHYGCGGVAAAVDGKRRGLVDHWLHPIRDLYREHRAALEKIPSPQARLDRLCEFNVMRQVRNVGWLGLLAVERPADGPRREHQPAAGSRAAAILAGLAFSLEASRIMLAGRQRQR